MWSRQVCVQCAPLYVGRSRMPKDKHTQGIPRRSYEINIFAFMGKCIYLYVSADSLRCVLCPLPHFSSILPTARWIPYWVDLTLCHLQSSHKQVSAEEWAGVCGSAPESSTAARQKLNRSVAGKRRKHANSKKNENGIIVIIIKSTNTNTK